LLFGPFIFVQKSSTFIMHKAEGYELAEAIENGDREAVARIMAENGYGIGSPVVMNDSSPVEVAVIYRQLDILDFLLFEIGDDSLSPEKIATYMAYVAYSDGQLPFVESLWRYAEKYRHSDRLCDRLERRFQSFAPSVRAFIGEQCGS